jgi:phosphoglycolate phosphatase
VNRPFDPTFIKAIVFDFDGTLARLNIDFSAMRSSIQSLMTEYRIPEAAAMDLHILEMIDAGGKYLTECRPSDAGIFRSRAHELVTGIEVEAAGRGALLDGTRAMLADLAARSVRTGVVTRNCRIAVLRVFPDISLHCQAFLTRDDTDRVKPHPDHLRSALRSLGVAPAAAVMVGDHPLDILLGRETGTYTIGVLTGHSGREELRSAHADLIIDKATDIINLFF